MAKTPATTPPATAPTLTTTPALSVGELVEVVRFVMSSGHSGLLRLAMTIGQLFVGLFSAPQRLDHSQPTVPLA